MKSKKNAYAGLYMGMHMQGLGGLLGIIWEAGPFLGIIWESFGDMLGTRWAPSKKQQNHLHQLLFFEGFAEVGLGWFKFCWE